MTNIIDTFPVPNLAEDDGWMCTYYKQVIDKLGLTSSLVGTFEAQVPSDDGKYYAFTNDQLSNINKTVGSIRGMAVIEFDGLIGDISLIDIGDKLVTVISCYNNELKTHTFTHDEYTAKLSLALTSHDGNAFSEILGDVGDYGRVIIEIVTVTLYV